MKGSEVMGITPEGVVLPGEDWVVYAGKAVLAGFFSR
jgi:hypothetical protein